MHINKNVYLKKKFFFVSEWFGTRRVLTFLAFIGFANVYAMRVNLSVAIVAMVNSTAIEPAIKNFTDICPLPVGNNSDTTDKVRNFYFI